MMMSQSCDPHIGCHQHQLLGISQDCCHPALQQDVLIIQVLMITFFLMDFEEFKLTQSME